jgi:hypothetical protein
VAEREIAKGLQAVGHAKEYDINPHVRKEPETIRQVIESIRRGFGHSKRLSDWQRT